MSRICLDTSACSHFQRGTRAVVEILDAAEWIGFPAVALGELRTGYLLGRRRRDNERWLRELLAHRVVEQLPTDGDVALIYAEIMVDLRRAGTPLPTNDVWIAATAVRHGAPVLTSDDHFLRIARVGCQLFEA